MALFRRRRQTAPVYQAAAPELSAEQLFELINGKLGDLIGADGQWTLVRRVDGDTDQIFHTMLSQQIATEVTRVVSDGRDALRHAPGIEPSALSWNPAPVALWAEPVATVQNQDAAQPAVQPASASLVS